ncbi:MAG TPA: YbhB/YbcL family Raf kinase inhibitor-like protein, partial [Thermoanaerobaculia bacterium]
MRVTSPAFPEGGAIPAKYTCDGSDVSPPLEWSGVPAETKSLALICDDPDAPARVWVHWVAYDLPASSAGL